ncbi:2-hydroxyacyl-CoA dehydratase subunit D [Chloroflexota bacterium]
MLSYFTVTSGDSSANRVPNVDSGLCEDPEVFNSIKEVNNNPCEWLMTWRKSTGRKVIGCLPMYVPEEIIHAGGCLPISMLGGNEISAQLPAYFPLYLCHPVKGNLDQVLRCGPDYLDGLVFADICDQMKHTGSVFQLHQILPFHYSLMLPKRLDAPVAYNYLVRELGRFKRAIEAFTEREISSIELSRSIALYNNTRRLIRELNLLVQRNSTVSMKEKMSLITAAMIMPKEDYNPLLTEYLKQIEARSDQTKKKIKVVLCGNQCELPGKSFLEILDELGVWVVEDDLWTGGRFFGTIVAETGDPLQSLAAAHMQSLPCPTRHHPDRFWADYIVEKVRSSGSQGAILVGQKFCEVHTFELPAVKAKLKQANIPFLTLETDGQKVTGKVRTQLEAFVEMVAGVMP